MLCALILVSALESPGATGISSLSNAMLDTSNALLLGDPVISCSVLACCNLMGGGVLERGGGRNADEVTDSGGEGVARMIALTGGESVSAR